MWMGVIEGRGEGVWMVKSLVSSVSHVKSGEHGNGKTIDIFPPLNLKFPCLSS